MGAISTLTNKERRHWASTRSIISNRTGQRRLIPTFHHDKGLKLTCWPLIKIWGVTYQTDRYHISKTIGYLVGVVKLACYSINTRLLLCVFTNNHLNSLTTIKVRAGTKNSRPEEFLR